MIKLFSLGLALCFLAGCASVKVDSATVEVRDRIVKPSIIYVQPFDTSKGVWLVDRHGTELEDFKRNASVELASMMVKRFPEIAPTQLAPNPLPKTGLLIAGEFTRVNQGSRALRMGIGFGAGGTKVETKVRLYDLSKSEIEPIATFKTTGGSNAQPGFIAGGWIAGPVAGGLNSTGLEEDWERTSREIRNFILDRVKHQGD